MARAVSAAACCALATGAASLLAAGVHKCVDAAGAVTYSGVPCGPEQTTSPDPLPPIGIFSAPTPAIAEGRRSGASSTAHEPRERHESAAPRRRAAGARAPQRPPVARPVGRARGTDSATQSGAGSGPVIMGRVSERRFVSIGMSDVEVLARLGKPDRVLGTVASPMQSGRGARGGGERWLYLPAAGDSETITVVVIDRGQVVDVDRRISR
jgi:hypothetical protein